MAQTTEPPETGVTDPPPPAAGDGDTAETPSTAHPPGYIGEMLKAGTLTQEQVDQMRASGWGWGEIRIATRLAQQMAANSNGTLTFEAALAQVQAARAEGKGFGQVAGENNLKVGPLVGDKKAAGGPDKGATGNGGDQTQASAAGKEKKPGLFARIGRFLGFGRAADKPVKPARVEKPAQSMAVAQADKPERPVRPDRPAKVEKPQRPEKPARPEKPEKGPHKG